MSGPDEPGAEAPATAAQPATGAQPAGFAGNPWRDAPNTRRTASPPPRRKPPAIETDPAPAEPPRAAQATPAPATPASSDATPSDATPSDAASSDAASSGTAPATPAPADATPSGTAPADSAGDTSPTVTPPAGAHPVGSELVPTEPGTSYADLIRRLAGAEADLARRRTAVHEWFVRQQARAEAEVARTAQRVAEASTALGTAQAAVEFTEAESARLWQILAGRMRLRDPATLGPPPGPDESGEPITEHPAHLLDQVREALDQVRPVKRRPAVGLPLLILGLIVLLVGIGYAAFTLAN